MRVKTGPRGFPHKYLQHLGMNVRYQLLKLTRFYLYMLFVMFHLAPNLFYFLRVMD